MTSGSLSYTYTCTTLADLPHQGIIPKGAAAWVESRKRPYVYDGSAWIDSQIPHPYWQAQATWYVDGVHGADDALGTTATAPLRTLRELQRRRGAVATGDSFTTGGAVNYTPQVTIYILDDAALGDIPQIDCGAGYIRIEGRPRTLHASTITSVQQTSKAADQQLEITDTALPSTGWAPYVGKMVRLLTDAGTPVAWGWVVKDLGGKTARVSDIWQFTTSGSSFIGSADYFQPGDHYDVCDLPFLPGITVTGPILAAICYLDLAGPNPSDTLYNVNAATSAGVVNLAGCRIPPYVWGVSAQLWNCLFLDWTVVSGFINFVVTTVLGGNTATPAFEPAGGSMTFYYDTLLQGCAFAVTHQSLVDTDDIGIFDCPSTTWPACTVQVAINSTIRTGRIWGQGNQDPGVNVRDSNCWLAWQGAIPQLQTASATKLLVHGVAHPYADATAGVVDATHQCGCIPA